MSYQCTEENFLKDVEEHQQVTLRDDGIYRHIRFKKPDTGIMHFDLVTWPGYLAYSGDMGCFVFCRLTDMFEFFRTDRDYKKRNGEKLAINLGYWAEKLQAVDGNRIESGATEFSEEKFRSVINEIRVGWIKGNRDLLTKEQRRELWEEVDSEILNLIDDRGGDAAINAAYDFIHRTDDRDFYFQDLFEHDFTQYTHRFIWCCYALAWGIQQYDSALTEAIAKAEDAA